MILSIFVSYQVNIVSILPFKLLTVNLQLDIARISNLAILKVLFFKSLKDLLLDMCPRFNHIIIVIRSDL